MTDKLGNMIDTFLSQRRESDDGGWAPVTPDDMKQLDGILWALIEAKWGKDPDGDRPVEYTLVDRTRYERNCFFSPHYWDWDKSQPEQKRNNILRDHMANTRIAISGLDRTIRCMEAYRKETDQ